MLFKKCVINGVRTAILNTADKCIRSNRLANDRNQPIVDEDSVSGLHYVGDVAVVQVYDLSVAVLRVRGVSGQLDSIAFLQFHFC